MSKDHSSIFSLANMIASKTPRTADSNYAFRMATCTREMYSNLISHVCRLANDGEWQNSGVIHHPDADLSAGSANLMALFEGAGGYLRAARQLLIMLQPANPKVANPPTSIAKLRIQLNLLVAVWDEVVVDRADPELASRAVALAKQIIIRSPEATASFVSECITVLGFAQAQSLLASATQYATSSHDAIWLAHAQEHVTKRMQSSLGSPAIKPRGKDGDSGKDKPSKDSCPKVETVLPLTASHRLATSRLTTLCGLFFGDIPDPFPVSSLKNRLFPLLAGPTGVGKTHVVQQSASQNNACYLKVTRGDWLPQGVRSGAGESTVFTILDLITKNDGARVVLHLDELDKLQDIESGKSDWAASQQTDIWNVLDGDLPFTTYLAARKTNLTESDLRKRVKSSLWIVGSGTWQDVFEKQRSGGVGFFPSERPKVDTNRLHASRKISPELLARFNNNIIFLEYPNLEETMQILAATGITSIAAQLGQTIAPASINWTQGGMRVLESIKTELTVQFADKKGRGGFTASPLVHSSN